MTSVLANALAPTAPFAELVLLIVIGVGLVQNVLYTAQLIVAFQALRRERTAARSRAVWTRYAEALPPVSILAPAYNEEAGVVESVRSLLALEYPSFEVIVINDGSKDRTLAVLIEAFELRPVQRAYEPSIQCRRIRALYGSSRLPRLLVVDKENGGKADALNAGINLSRAPLFCGIDADSMLDVDALLRIAQAFAENPAGLIAAGGTIRVANGCTIRGGRIEQVGLPASFPALFQSVEYLRAFLMARVALSRLGALLVISGAFGVFRRATAIEVGGYSHGTVGEDLELVVKLHRLMRDRGQPYRVMFVPEPACWTEVPESLAVLGRQRARWQRGALETFVRHWDMLNPWRYGRVAWLGFGQMLLIDVIGPVAEVLGYLLVLVYVLSGALSIEYFYAFTALTFVFGVGISAGAVVLQEINVRHFETRRELVIIFCAAIVENFGYRQLCNLWRLRGSWQYLRGTTGWGVMPRKGLGRD